MKTNRIAAAALLLAMALLSPSTGEPARRILVVVDEREQAEAPGQCFLAGRGRRGGDLYVRAGHSTQGFKGRRGSSWS